MDSEADDHVESDQTTRLDRFRERFATWGTFAALVVFFVVTIAFWGWAAWQAVAYLVGLVF